VKIHLLSDLHLEFSDRHPPFEPPPTDADVVVIAGDIDCGTNAFDWAEETFPNRPVLYVPGNHEYYDGDVTEVSAALRDRAASSPNVRLLDNDEVVVDGVRFLGATLWTDFELFGPSRMPAAFEDSVRYVMDFRKIRDRNALFTPQRSIELHRASIAFLQRAIDTPHSGQTVVITHHAPHAGSLHPLWASHLSSAAFVSDLTRLMGKPALWVHGHTHNSFRYEVNGTRVSANPMGYRTSNWREARTTGTAPWVKYENAQFDPALTIEV
jgi:Icc-related predicted phosphoesterase